MLKNSRNLYNHLTWLRARESQYVETEIKCRIVHEYNIINGYSAYLSGEALDNVRNHDDVASVSENVLGNWATAQ
ncbi:peptidase inhibitor i9 domain-containing protein [Rhizoctonia solani AG-1 IA]|uniref:Peptidase inhibitor i9 domain-containing protein n=1 Tax=Thanatephorus cucumeris (strain AG1-IA) TaxID=983506 RepID=L8WDW2_THACA|nr:peptidase inhibitor i9 domain-containing protein [Rhizoctonia solani AG-1 IA]